MPEVKDRARVDELKSALRNVLDENNRISDGFKIEEKGVVVSQEQADAYRANLEKARELKSLIDGLEGTASLEAFLEAPEEASAAVAAGASAAAGLAEKGLWVPRHEVKSLGRQFVESDEFKAMRERGMHTMDQPWEVKGYDFGSLERKDVYTASGPAATNRGFGRSQWDPMVPAPQRRTRIRDLFPVATTNANLIDFYRVVGYTNDVVAGTTNAAAPVAERLGDNSNFGLKPKTSLQFSLGQAPVRTIAHYELAHRNVLQDEPQLQSVINNELMYGLRLAEDDQLLNGDGTGENLLGILQTPGIQTYDQADDGGAPAAATETKLDALRRAATRVILAYYEPTGYVLHPYDWESIELEKDNEGRYILVMNVAVGAESRVWRQPVVETPAMAQGTYLTGAWGLGAQLYDREQSNIRIAEQHSDLFIRNAVAILAEQRLALAVKRPESFVTGSFFVPA